MVDARLVGVIPEHMNDAPPPVYADSIDVPVLFRSGPARRPHPQWRTAQHAPWEATGLPPSNGWYIPTTTWRKIIKAAPGTVRQRVLGHDAVDAEPGPRSRVRRRLAALRDHVGAAQASFRLARLCGAAGQHHY